MRLTTADRARAVILSAGITEKSRVNILLLGGLIESAIQQAVQESTDRAERERDEALAALRQIVPENFEFEGQNLRSYSAKGHMECVRIAQEALAATDKTNAES